MDITILFKACVKTVQTTNKQLGIKDSKPSTSILKTHNKDVHLSKAKEIVKQISQLQAFLVENKAAYLNVINYLSTGHTMTEIDREEVDSAAEKIVLSCTQLINDFRKETSKIKLKQRQEHYYNITSTIESYLKNVSRIYTEAKAVRVKRVIDTHKLSKLETRESKKVVPASPTTPQVNFDDQLSAEDMQMFESENEHLFNELNNISDEVKQMESKVVHIAELQELFTEKVLQQEKDIERISENVANSTDNVRDANEQIRQAIQQNAGLRVWVLFFLLIMSFSLLFLDWYND